MKLRLSIKSNLLVEVNLDDDLKMKNAGIQSYTTMVGSIEDGKVIENGIYSRTTGKHMSFIRAITELPVETSKKRPFFYWHHDGVKIAHEDSISPEASVVILKELSSGKTIFEAISVLEKMKKKDLSLTNEILEGLDLKEAMESYRKIKGSFVFI
jgi:hypothetical protein